MTIGPPGSGSVSKSGLGVAIIGVDVAHIADLVALGVAAAIVTLAVALRHGDRGARRRLLTTDGANDPRPLRGPTWADLPRRLAQRTVTVRTERRLDRSAVDPSAVATWVDDVARAVRRGDAARTALHLEPIDPVVARRTRDLRRAVGRGDDLDRAVQAWRTRFDDRPPRRGDEHLRLAAVVIGVGVTAGGSLAAPLERLAAALRQRAALDLERRAHAAQARMSAVVLTVLPVGVLATLAVADGGVRDVLSSPLGAALVGAGLAIDGVGAWWMHRIVSAQP